MPGSNGNPQGTREKGWESVAELLSEKLCHAIQDALEHEKDLLEDVARAGGKEAGKDIAGDIGLVSKVLGDVLLGLLLFDPPVAAGVEAFKQAEKHGGRWAVAGALGYMMGYTLFTDLMPLNQPLQHAVAAEFTNEIHDPATSADLVARGHWDHGSAADEAAGTGLDVDHFNRMLTLAQQHPDVGTVLEQLRRGVVDHAGAERALKRLGYLDDQIPKLLALRRVILSPADLALAELRHVISHDQAMAYLPLTGMNEPDYETLVGNTGEPPGTMELLFAFRRGFIDRERLARGIRQSRTRNEWIDVVERLRYSPMSTESAVRGVIEHYLTEAEGRKIADQNGLLPEHWEPLLLSWGRPLAHGEMASLVHRGLASRKQFDQAMHESNLKDKYTELSFDVTSRLLPERLLVDAIKFGALTLQEGAKQLLQLGYDRHRAKILLELGLKELQQAAHTLTKTDVLKLYAEQILSRDDALHHLTALGYTEQDAKLELQLQDVQAHAKEVSAETAVIRSTFLAGTVDAVQAVNELRKLGLTEGQAHKAVETWEREKKRASRSLSESQIVKAAKTGTYSPDHAITLLVSVGYTRSDAATLLTSNGVALDGSHQPAAATLSEAQIVKAAKEGVYAPQHALDLLVAKGYTHANARTLLLENRVALGPAPATGSGPGA